VGEVNVAEPEREIVVEWGSAGLALEEESGDARVVAGFPGGTLVAVIDGLGHGWEAAVAARAAVEVLEAHAGRAVTELVQLCHEALHKTRGAVMTLASFDARRSSMSCTSVGNVEALLVRADRAADPPRETIALRGGVVGYQLPQLRASSFPVSPGDTLILASDGIRSGFGAGLRVYESPQQMADSILAEHARGADDAMVLVARYLGATP
jgi:phosphoserine phosphatase RsbX